MTSLTRSEILDIKDIQTKKIRVPVWNQDIYIRQLTRGQQDNYLKRQYGHTKVLQEGKKAERQEVAGVQIFGHDAFLFVCGVCDENGERLFTEKDIPSIQEKNGEAIGFVAKEIVIFSGMQEEVNELEELENLKN